MRPGSPPAFCAPPSRCATSSSRPTSGSASDRGLDLAGSLAFTTLLLAIPLLATFALLLAAFFQDNVGQIVDLVNRILPFQAAQVSQSLREFIRESIAISGIGLAVLIGSSVRLIFVVEGTFNDVWGAPRRRDWMPRIAIYSLMILALALLVGSIGIGLRHLEHSSVGAVLLGSPAAENAFRFAVEWLSLALLYRFLPNAYVRWRAAAVAGGVIAIGFELMRALFGLYVQALSSMNLITGYLALILLFLLSVFLVWLLILLGVELTRAVQDHVGRPERLPGRRAGRAENAVRMLLKLSEGEPHAFRELYDDQEADAGEVAHILSGLLAHGLIEGDASNGYTLGRKPWQISVAEIVEAVSPDLYSISPRDQDRVVLVLEPLFARLEKERRSLLGTTLADLNRR